MNPAFSVYLDLVRFAAAFLVYLWHSNQRFLTKSILPASSYGHSSVIVFFVLSGFVIAFITDTKETILSRYMASRISRVYSVVIPTLVLTLILDAAGRGLYPEIYNYPYDQFLVRFLCSVFMVDEVWFISITSFSNVPYWSICYEWWYYVSFALVAFAPPKVGLTLMLLSMLLIGPKLILLAPIWWLGVLLYRWCWPHSISTKVSWLLVIFSTLGIVAFHVFDPRAFFVHKLAVWYGPEVPAQLTFSKWFLMDYVLGVLVFVNFVGVRNVVRNGSKMLLALQKPIRTVAGFTFTLYLLHQPLFLFWAAVIHGNPEAPWYWTGVTLLTMLSVVLIGSITENKRHVVRHWLEPRLEPLDVLTTAAFSRGNKATQL